ncbi:MAG: UvrD-helicase domain-containing protein [Pseudomonadota bacterium]
MNKAVPLDAAIREQALDPRLCCIVQAPAGSGKTELLIQRMLVLLAEVERPEEILAITFTRKAAGEMRARILHALREADSPLPENAPGHLVRQRERARAALARDRALGWNLLEQPARLRIQTIDAFSHGLAARLPLTARFGAAAVISDEPGDLYREAASNVVERIESAMDVAGQGSVDEDAAALEALLRHLGNDLARVRDLLAAMLGKRDQWGRHVFTPPIRRALEDRTPQGLPAWMPEGAERRDQRIGDGPTGASPEGADQGWSASAHGPGERRAALEEAIRRMVEDELNSLHALFPAALRDETACVAAMMCAHLMDIEVAPDDRRLLWDVPGWPEAGTAGLVRWQGLADLLLTDKGEWRKALSANNGVPAPSEKGIDKETKSERAAFKARVTELLDALRGHPDLACALHATRAMPEPAYGDADWAVLEALLHLLKQAWAQLLLIFAARGEVDFVETAQGALRALGEPEAPSDLLLAFDYRLRHILLDEFQDTSHSQFALLERLVSGWQPGAAPFTELDGRSLFLVGDPMQSIYRFREAEVGLFLRAQREGVRCGGGVLRLAPLTLGTNFRSQAGVVEWVNAVFPRVLAERENIAEGAVPYTPSTAHHPPAEGEAVRLHLFTKPGKEDGGPESGGARPQAGGIEAAEVVRLTREALARLETDGEVKPADRSVAILVRSRGHLARILPGLRAAGVSFQAVEIEQLADQPMVQDLLALTRALLHPADRIAWLAVLRAPWCGLRLSDLHALAGDGAETTLWRCMHDEARVVALGDDGRARLLRLREVLAASLAESGRVPLRRQVEGAWLALGGPACARSARELEEARIFFDLLDAMGDEVGVETLERELEALFAPPEGGARVQVMTIHKSKGLQFHTVIVPGLARVPRGSDSQLLLWLEREANHIDRTETDLLLAPIKGQGEKDSPLYTWLRRIQDARGSYEDGRLLYVAATRAIRRLHLLAEVPLDKDGGWKPPARSLLARLWPGIEERVESPGPQEEGQGGEGFPDAVPLPPGHGLRRLPLDWRPPASPPAIPVGQAAVQPLSGRPLRSAVGSQAHRSRAAWQEEKGNGWHEGDETPRHVGTLVHRLLERIALDGAEQWPEGRLRRAGPALRRALRELGVVEGMLDEGLGRVLRAIEGTLADPRGRWILAAHEDARCEWALGGVIGGVPVSAVIDRSFIDQKTRWIIDYKTAEPAAGETLSVFLDRQQEHYRPQLEGYAGLLAALDPDRPVRLGLYFPLLGGWREWSVSGAG